MLFAVSLHLYFLKDSIPFLYSGGDPLDQFAKYQLFLHENFRNFNLEWSWLNGLGGDILGQFGYYYSTSLFFLIKLFFPLDSLMQLAKISLYVSIGKAILASSFFYLYMIANERTKTAALIGTIIYIGAIKFMQFSFFSDFMSDAFVFLPLVVWGLERLLKLGKPLLFIFASFLMIQSNFYFAYITTIYISIYTLLYLFLQLKQQSIPKLIKKGLAVEGAYLIALFIASYSFLPAVYQFFNAYRFSKEYEIPLTYPMDFYLNMPVGLFMKISMITIPAIVLFIWMASFQFKKYIPSIHLWMAFIFFIFYQIPYMYSIFNGFSAMQSRWTYLFIFSLAIVVTYTVDEWKQGKNIHLTVFLLYVVYLLYALIGKYALESLSQYNNGWIIISIHCILPFFFVIQKRYRQSAMTILFGLLLVLVSLQQWNFFEEQLGDPASYKETIIDMMDSYDKNEEVQEIFQWIESQPDSFARYSWYLPYTNQLGNFREHNNSMLYGMPSLAYYQSLFSNDLGKFIYEDFKIKQFDSFSHFYNVDERLFLETYLQANYTIVNKDYSYKPDGYTLVYSTTHYKIYKLKSPMPFAYVQNQVVHAKEFDALSIGSRDMLLLQAYRSDDHNSTNTNASYDLPIVLYESAVPFEETNYFNTETNTLQLEQETSFTIPLQEVPSKDAQILASFTIEEVHGKSFTLKIENSFMKKRESEHTYSLPIQAFTMLVDSECKGDTLNFTLTAGSYHLSDITIEMLPINNMSNYQQAALNNAFDLKMLYKNKVQLTGQANNSGMLVTSIPYSEGWHVEIDGKKGDLHRINGAFIGIPVETGNTTIELTYHSPYLRTGLWLSLLTYISLLIAIFYKRRLQNM